MADSENKITSMASNLLKNPNVLPGAGAILGGGMLLSGLFGRKEKPGDDNEMHRESIFNLRTLIGGVLTVGAFTMIARRNGFDPAILKPITDKLHIGSGRGA